MLENSFDVIHDLFAIKIISAHEIFNFVHMSQANHSRTDAPADGQTDIPSYRDASMLLKQIFLLGGYFGPLKAFIGPHEVIPG